MRLIAAASGLEDLTTGGTGAVLATGRARGVRQVLLTARCVGAGDQGGHRRLPLGTAVPRVAPGQLPLRDGHGSLLALGLLIGLFVVWVSRPSGQGGPSRVDVIVVPVVRIHVQVRPAVEAQPCTVRPAQWSDDHSTKLPYDRTGLIRSTRLLAEETTHHRQRSQQRKCCY